MSVAGLRTVCPWFCIASTAEALNEFVSFSAPFALRHEVRFVPKVVARLN
jgi:hypothetical protein